MTDKRNVAGARPAQQADQSMPMLNAASPTVGESQQLEPSAQPPSTLPSGWTTKVCAGVAIVTALFIWTFWYSLVDLWRIWQRNPDYSAGQLVPLAAAYMVAVQRRRLVEIPLSFDPRGLVLFGLGVTANLFGYYYLYGSLQNLGLVLGANGVAMTLLGWQGYKRVWYPMVFLLLALPLPGRVHGAIMLPLQRFVAHVSAVVLEVIGVPVVRFGHILEIDGRQVSVAEACNGLRMALAFLIVAAVVAYLIQRPRWQKLIVILSSLPIAIVCNVIRVVVTASLFGTSYEWLARDNMHDVMGMAMMPAALVLMLLELWLFSKLAPEGRPLESTAPASGKNSGKRSPGAMA